MHLSVSYKFLGDGDWSKRLAVREWTPIHSTPKLLLGVSLTPAARSC